MNFVAKTWSCGKARTGHLQLGNCPSPIETPALLLPTCKGLPFFISPDLLPSLQCPDASLLHLSPLQFLDGLTPKTIEKVGGIHKLVGLHDCGFAALARDAVSCHPDFGATSKLGAAFGTPCGRHLVNTGEYMEWISSLQPNIWTSIADEVPFGVSEKRNKLSVDRTVKWLDECIANSPKGAIFGAIVGGSNIIERNRCVSEIAKRDVSGYWIAGFGFGEDINERNDLMNSVTDCLAKDKPRLISGLEFPVEVLHGVAAGIDIFHSPYTYRQTVDGYALTFPLDLNDWTDPDSEHKKLNLDPEETKLDLKSTIYRRDGSPIVKNCRCYTCQNHTRAYINHLLNVREMLGQTLLDIHNTYHYLGFFRMIRESIRNHKFDLLRQRFVQKWQVSLPEASILLPEHVSSHP